MNIKNRGKDNFLKKHMLKGVMAALLILVTLLSLRSVHAYFGALEKIAVEENINVAQNSKPTFILDKNGNVLYEIPRAKEYNYVSLNEMSEYIVEATIAVEDSTFYKHRGVRPLSMLRAAVNNFKGGEIQGASTITQQLIKNTLLTPERTTSRKIQEVFLALTLEKNVSKDRVLEMYLNNISFGGTAWGVQSASKKYFDKNASELTLAEASLLAGLPKAPSLYSPLHDINAAKSRQKFVLDRMVEESYISAVEAQQAYDVELAYVPQIHTVEAPHFVFYILSELRDNFTEEELKSGGMNIYTTLDLGLQRQAEKIVKEQIEQSENLNISNGSVVVMDVKTGEILAYVGSYNYFNESFGKVDMVNSRRQLGSAVKPVTYALAFKSNKYTPATLINDAPVRLEDTAGNIYEPRNYDERFHGSVTLRSALANSYNVPAILLARDIGPQHIVEQGVSMGLTSWEAAQDYGVAITLGSVEATLLELTNTFGTLARGGIYTNPKGVKYIQNETGKTIFVPENITRDALDNNVAFLVTHILSDPYARIPAFGYNSLLNVSGHKVAVKTGTTDSKRDNYTVGYTPSYVVGVWVGNNDNTPMHQSLASGLSGAAPIWNQVMTQVLTGQPTESFLKPENVILIRDEECDGLSEYFLRGSNIPERLCTEDEEDSEDSDNDDKDNDEDDD